MTRSRNRGEYIVAGGKPKLRRRKLVICVEGTAVGKGVGRGREERGGIGIGVPGLGEGVQHSGGGIFE